MKTLCLLLSLFMSATVFAAGDKLSESEILSLKAKTCGELVRYTKSQGIHTYDFLQCLRTTRISSVSEIYNPKPSAPVVLSIHLDDAEISEIKEMDLSLFCTLEIQAPVTENEPKDIFCSIEG